MNQYKWPTYYSSHYCIDAMKQYRCIAKILITLYCNMANWSSFARYCCIINCHSYDDTTTPCKRAPVCHVAVESNLYFSNAIVLLHCINAVMTRVVLRPFILIHSFDRNGFLHVLFVVEIIQLPLSALL